MGNVGPDRMKVPHQALYAAKKVKDIAFTDFVFRFRICPKTTIRVNLMTSRMRLCPAKSFLMICRGSWITKNHYWIRYMMERKCLVVPQAHSLSDREIERTSPRIRTFDTQPMPLDFEPSCSVPTDTSLIPLISESHFDQSPTLG